MSLTGTEALNLSSPSDMPDNRPEVLIVEDEVVTAMLIKRIVEKMGGRVITICVTGEEALDEIRRRKKMDLIILDIFLQRGEMTGIDFARHINRTYQMDNIVFLTANTDEATRSEALKTRHLAYLEKPLTRKKLNLIFKDLERD